MKTVTVKGLGGLKAQLRRDAKKRAKRVKTAVRRTVRKGAQHVRRNVPVAFSELRDSVKEEPARILVDAPHAAPVEVGSRPHWPPLAPLVEWVKLRQLQAGVSERSRKHLPGTSTQGIVADIDPEEEAEGIARAIQFKIAREGTEPVHYMARSLPVIERILDTEIKMELGK